MSDIIVPSSPDDLKAINKAMRELSNSMLRQDSEKDYQNETYKELEEKYGIKAKHLRKMAKDFYKDEFKQKVGEMEDYQQLYESVFETNFNDDDEED